MAKAKRELKKTKQTEKQQWFSTWIIIFVRNLKEKKNEKKKLKQSKQTVGEVYLKVHPTLKMN